ncbi:MAG: GPR1/FUN34/YaaH family transporter [Nitrospiraceae bacterium]
MGHPYASEWRGSGQPDRDAFRFILTGGLARVGEDPASRRIDVLAIGLFGLAVGALTLGAAQLGGIPESDEVGTLVIALIVGGVVQILAGITDIRYHEHLGGTAFTIYGFFWFTVSVV